MALFASTNSPPLYPSYSWCNPNLKHTHASRFLDNLYTRVPPLPSSSLKLRVWRRSRHCCLDFLTLMGTGNTGNDPSASKRKETDRERDERHRRETDERERRERERQSSANGLCLNESVRRNVSPFFLGHRLIAPPSARPAFFFNSPAHRSSLFLIVLLSLPPSSHLELRVR